MERMQMVAGTEPTRQKFFAKRGATQHGRQSIGEVDAAPVFNVKFSTLPSDLQFFPSDDAWIL